MCALSTQIVPSRNTGSPLRVLPMGMIRVTTSVMSSVRSTDSMFFEYSTTNPRSLPTFFSAYRS